MADYNLSAYDGVLAFGNVIRDLYLANGWTARAWTWHEAADTRIFRPLTTERIKGDVVWIGNWGDDERSDELYEFLINPVRTLGLKACVYGVRYPEHARQALANAGIEYGGWLPNYEAPQVFGRYRLTVHVPRRPYVQQLPGIPTIRPFEALACGIPLVCSPWDDAEHLFTPGEDYLVARDRDEMREHIQMLLSDSSTAARISAHGLRTVRERHTCSHRVTELLAICRDLREEEQERVVTA
jgi:spore maturation protein CgeB